MSSRFLWYFTMIIILLASALGIGIATALSQQNLTLRFANPNLN